MSSLSARSLLTCSCSSFPCRSTTRSKQSTLLVLLIAAHASAEQRLMRLRQSQQSGLQAEARAKTDLSEACKQKVQECRQEKITSNRYKDWCKKYVETSADETLGAYVEKGCGGGGCCSSVGGKSGKQKCKDEVTTCNRECGTETCCENGGTWADKQCTCPATHTGDFCEIPNCEGKCGDNGDCVTATGKCDCKRGYSGENCETAPDACEYPQKVVCENGGTCKDGKCECPADWVGDRCETSKQEQTCDEKKGKCIQEFVKSSSNTYKARITKNQMGEECWDGMVAGTATRCCTGCSSIGGKSGKQRCQSIAKACKRECESICTAE